MRSVRKVSGLPLYPRLIEQHGSSDVSTSQNTFGTHFYGWP